MSKKTEFFFKNATPLNSDYCRHIYINIGPLENEKQILTQKHKTQIAASFETFIVRSLFEKTP